jgi:RND superfamily putative drug exporter
MPDSTRVTPLVRLADWSYRRRRLMVLLWFAGLVATIVLSQQFGGESSITFAAPGKESQEAQDLLESRFPARSGDNIDVVFAADAGVDDPAVRSAVDTFLAEAEQAGHVTGVVSPYTPEGARQISPKGTIAFATLQLDVPAEDFPVSEARHLIDLAESHSTGGVRFELSSFAIQGAQQADFSSEGIGLLVAAFILLVSFGSVLAMGLPLLIAIFGLTIASGLIVLLANFVQVPDFTAQVAAMIGIGVGIDYVLFIVTRYRSSLQLGMEPRQAVITSITTSGRAVLFAGCTVVISVMGLFVMNLGFLRGLALGAASVVLVVMLASVTLLPAVLGFIGRTIDRLRVPFVRTRPVGDRRGLAYRWSRVVQHRPWTAAIVSVVVLVALAVPLFSLQFGFPDAGNDPPDFTTRQAYDLLTEGFGPGFNGPLLLVAETGELGGDPSGALAALRQEVTATPGVQFVGEPVPSPDGSLALLVTYPSSSPQDAATEDLVNRLRSDVLPDLTDSTGLRVLVGGTTAASIDVTRYIADRLPLFIGSVLTLSFLLLLVVFRSLLVPLKAAIMNLLSIGAAYGVMATLVRGGWFGGLFGIHEPVPIPSFVPMMMFAILFGLSMDYEVFLLSRIREEYVRTGDNASAVADGLAATARVITAAAAIMISVFLAFVLGDEVFLKIIGVGLATAIFIDATVVRMVLVPSTMELLGDANWWLPGWLERRLPRIHVEGESADTLQAELDELVEEQQARSSHV